jgi:hypothetical protein
MIAERKSMRNHLIYLALIIILLIVIGLQSLPLLWETTADIPGNDNKSSYTLRMLGSGDLIFEKQRFLPLASYHDYWGDMSISSVDWAEDRKVMITMSDGTELTITLGSIELRSPGARN